MSFWKLSAIYSVVLLIVGVGMYVASTMFGRSMVDTPPEWLQEGSFSVPVLLGLIAFAIVGGPLFAYMFRLKKGALEPKSRR